MPNLTNLKNLTYLNKTIIDYFNNQEKKLNRVNVRILAKLNLNCLKLQSMANKINKKTIL